jgi:hypothetical protein
MATLNLYLTDGFKNDRVAIHVNGRKVFDEAGLTTKSLIGLAKQLSPISVDGQTARLEVELPEKGLRTTINADLSKGNQVPIGIENGEFTHSVLKQIGFG